MFARLMALIRSASSTGSVASVTATEAGNTRRGLSARVSIDQCRVGYRDAALATLEK